MKTLKSLEGFFVPFDIGHESSQISHNFTITIVNSQVADLVDPNGKKQDYLVLRVPNPVALEDRDRAAIESIINMDRAKQICIVIVDKTQGVAGIIPYEEFHDLLIAIRVDGSLENKRETFGADTTGILRTNTEVVDLSLWWCPHHPELKPIAIYETPDTIPLCPKCHEKRVPYKLEPRIFSGSALGGQPSVITSFLQKITSFWPFSKK